MYATRSHSRNAGALLEAVTGPPLHKTLQPRSHTTACGVMTSPVLTAFKCKAVQWRRQEWDNGVSGEYLQPFDAGADLRQQQSREHTKRQGMRAAPHGWTVLTGHEYREQSGYLGSDSTVNSHSTASSSKPCNKSYKYYQWHLQSLVLVDEHCESLCVSSGHHLNL